MSGDCEGDGIAVTLADGDVHRGRAIDLTAVDVDAETLLRGIRGDSASVTVSCPTPGPLFSHVAHLRSAMSFDRRGALAALARQRGETPPQAAAIAALDATLAELNASATRETSELAVARERVAEAGSDEAELREAVAAKRGRLTALREVGEPTADAAADLREAVEALAVAETERIAAEQRLAALERAASDARDERDRRMALADERANRRREARRWLAARVYATFADAVRTVADELDTAATPGTEPGEYEGDPLTAACAVVRVARLRAPVVLAETPFPTAARAAAVLDAPVVCV